MTSIDLMSRLDQLIARRNKIIDEINDLGKKIGSCSKNARVNACSDLLTRREELVSESDDLKQEIKDEMRKKRS